MTDAELVKRISEGDELALEMLRSKYGTYCEGIAMKFLMNEQEVQEVINGVWLQVWERIPTAKPANLKQYLAKSTRNSVLHFIEYHNAQKRCGICVQLDELAECIPESVSSIDVDSIHLRDVMNQFLRGLNPVYRQIFVNRYWYGDSIRDLAEKFRCSENRVGVILFRCRKQLKQYLEKEEIWL